MKKYIHNILNIRLVMIALFAIVCNTSKAQVEDSPLNPWWDSSANSGSGGYVLRTIDSEHTVLDAMKALQEINGGDWSSYSSSYFYLAEDVDLAELGENWVPLGTSDYPFQGYFYCYKLTYSWFNGPGNQPSDIDNLYPKFTDEEKPEPLVWDGAYKYTFNIGDITSSEDYSYADIDEFISNNLAWCFVEYDESTLSVSMLESDMESATILSTLVPTSKEQAYYKLLPTNHGALGYYNDDSGTQTYYSTDGHIGTCKIKNMTVDGDYDAAGFFGYVDDESLFNGFTFENCSVTNTKSDGYAGILYGYCDESSNAPYITDIFIGQSGSPCSVTADYTGGIYGYNAYENDPYIYSTSSISSYIFDPELVPYDPETHEGAYYADDYDGSDGTNGTTGSSINKIYVSITANTRGNKISSINSEANYTYVCADGIVEKFAFGTDENGEYGDGTQDKPFIISSEEHLLHLRSILNGINEDSYKNYEDLRDLSLYVGSSSSAMFDGCYFKQTADIDLGELTTGIGIDDSDSNTEAGPFAGTYDGDGHTIKVNITSSETETYTALFANTYGATIKNLSIEGKNNNNYQYGYAAGIVGKEQSSSDYLTLDNCFVNVKIDAKHGKYGLICDCSTDYIIIKDCFNKGANNLEWFSGADEYYKYQMEQGNTIPLFSWTEGGGTGTPGCPLQISSLSIFKTEKGNEFAKYGLTYELTNNTFLQDVKLVDPDGDYVGPNDTSDNDCYIEEFCGTLSGKHTYMHTYPDSSTGEVTETYIISGLTDKALFGTITGDSKIEKIGFVNCYNATNTKVNLANSIADDASLEVDKCYSDGFFDMLNGTSNVTISNSYSYSEMKTSPVSNYWVKNEETDTKTDYYSSCMGVTRYILSENCIPIIGLKDEYGYSIDDAYTDAIATQPSSNEITSTSDPRLQFKYNVAYNGKVRYMKLIDTMDYYEILKNQLNDYEGREKFENGIRATEFTGIPNNVTIDHIYYCRKAHNDWESVTLPFAYGLSNVLNSSKFKAYTFSGGNANNATFSSSNTEIEAGTPMLISVEGETDFVVKKSNPIFVNNPNGGKIFKGALRIIESVEGKYKIDGTKIDDGGTLLECTADSWIYPFRAYLDFGSSAGAKSLRFSISDDTTTSIDAAELAPTIVATGEIYGIDGRKVSAKGLNSLKPGLYIMNGKKYVVK